MKITRAIQFFLSYFYDIRLEQAVSHHNKQLENLLSQGRIKLVIPNAVYSFKDFYNSFRSAFNILQTENRKIKGVLVLGFGLGSVPLILEKIYNKNANYIGVEIDENIIFLAHKYNSSLRKINLQLIKYDALDYVKNCKEKFDLIAADLFIDNKVPEQFESEDFCRNLKQLLLPDGPVLFSQIFSTKESEKHGADFLQGAFKNIFPLAECIKTKGNIVLHN